jgi:hypothetical protein
VQGSLSLLGIKSLKYPLLSETQPCPGDNTTVNRLGLQPQTGSAGQSALLLTLPFLPQAAAPAALWAVPSVPRAVSAKRHLTSAAAVPDVGTVLFPSVNRAIVQT